MTAEETDDEKEEEYEKVCFICRRPESKAGKMIELPNNITVCQDCMQKSFDAMNNAPIDFSKMMGNMPGIQFLNLSDLENTVPKRQKIKKKKQTEEKKVKKLTLKDIPAPHKIKAQLDDYVVGQEYAKKAAEEEKVIFGGRLGEYKYYDMDQVIAAALHCCDQELH